ncbi:hypothetical protein KJ359_006523 [Pestalotiopsis sp. 9143b]|nr:hypothetical protein KJ359_006523 [Pestalotiopsis sp. 9143b]
MACLSPCFTTSTPAAEETSSSDDKHSNKVRARLGKPLKPIFKPVNAPIELVRTPTEAFDQYIAMSPRSRTAPPAPAPAATTPLTVEELGELFDKIDKTLSGPGISYAICGLAAMITHGLTGRGANTVSILVPEDSKDVIRPWVLAGGNGVTRKESTHGFELSMSDGTTRVVKIRWIEGEAFEKLGIASSHMGSRLAKVLMLVSCLEQVASAFLKECKGGRPPAPSKHVETIVLDIRGALESATIRGTPLDPAYLELFLSPQFWSLFHAYMGDQTPEVMILCTKAQLPVAAALDEARRQSEVRQHDALLGQYGAQPMLGGVVEQQPGAFQNMRTLGRDHHGSGLHRHTKSKGSRGDVSPAAGRSLTAKAWPRRPSEPDRGRVSLDEQVLRRPPSAARAPAPPARSSSTVRPRQDASQSRESFDLVAGKGGKPDGWL